jgi:hypothetical protein
MCVEDIWGKIGGSMFYSPAIERIVAIAPFDRGSAIYLDDGSIVHVPTLPDQAYSNVLALTQSRPPDGSRLIPAIANVPPRLSPRRDRP